MHARLSIRILPLALALLAIGCAEDWRPRSGDGAISQHPGRSAALAGSANRIGASATMPRRTVAGFARLPDRGDLVGYPAQRVVRRDGAYTWHRADLSEAHALAAIVDGSMRVTTPSGETLDFAYERHEEHASGDWTWVGRLEHGTAADEVVLTFGDRAAFGTISQPGREPLRLTIRDGASWLIETDATRVAEIRNRATQPKGPDYLVPPANAFDRSGGSVGPTMASAPSMQAATTTSSPVIDLVLGYTPGFAAAYGGQSQAVTRLNNMVAITNEAYANSQITGRVRLVHTLQVSYADNTDNGDTLEKLSGYKSGSGWITPDPAFNALRAARDQYGADLVSIVRKFNDPENDGCGIAWMIGGGGSTVDTGDAPFGYSVVSDGQDQGADGKTYFCRDETLAHEIGHNLGSQHDKATATKDGKVSQGAYSYSFGYKTDSTNGNFYTVMAYGDSGQTRYRVFSNPRITFCGGRVCGTAEQSDNARSQDQTMPVIAQFRATVVAAPPAVQAGVGPNLVAIARMGASGRTESHVLGGADYLGRFIQNVATALHSTGTDLSWRFQLGDYNRDGTLDMFVFAKMGSSGTTELHVLNGANGYQSFLAQRATVLHRTGTDDAWVFKLGDYNRDGFLDVYAIARRGSSGRTEVHVMNGADGYSSFLAHMATAIPATGADGAWDFALADYNRDGVLDLYAVSKLGSSLTTELHVVNGANGFQSFLLQTATALHVTGSDRTWAFKVGDYNGDGTADLYAINKRGGSLRTEVHVLDGASRFQQFAAHIATALHTTDNSWEFELRN